MSQEEKVTDIKDKALEKLQQDPAFQKAMSKYEEAETKAQEISTRLTKELVNELNLEDTKQTVEDARFNLLVAKLAAIKALVSLTSFNYTENDFMESMIKARKCVQNELVPMLMQVEPCGECEQCKNGHKDKCIRPNVRQDHCESRFLPLICDSLIEYDAWSEILYNNIPADLKDEDVLGDINDEFQNEANKIIPKKGRPPKKKDKEEE